MTDDSDTSQSNVQSNDKRRQPHDALARYMLSHPTVVADELRANLPADIVDAIDLDQIEPVPASFTDAALVTTHNDLVMRAPYRNNPDSYLYFYIVIEHHSSPKKDIAERLLRTILKIWDYARKNEKLPDNQHPLVLPYIIYHGKHRWLSNRNLHDSLDPAAKGHDLAKHDIQLELLLNDLPRVTDDDLAERPGSLLWRIMSVLFARQRDLTTMLEILDRIAATHPERLTGEDATTVLVYIMKIGHIDRVEDIQEIITHHPNLEETMTTYIQDDIEFLRDALAKSVREEITEQVTQQVTEQVTKHVTEQVTQLVIEQGIEQGRQQALERHRATLANYATSLFGELPPAAQQRINTASTDQIDRWLATLHTANTIEDALA